MRQSKWMRCKQKGQALTEYMILLVMIITLLVGVGVALKGNVIGLWEEITNRVIGPTPLKKPDTPKRVGK